jgi:hypothetical protein
MVRRNGWQKRVRDLHQLERICTDGASGPTVDVQDVIKTTKMKSTFSKYPPKMPGHLLGSHTSPSTKTTDVQDVTTIKRHHHLESTTTLDWSHQQTPWR